MAKIAIVGLQPDLARDLAEMLPKHNLLTRVDEEALLALPNEGELDVLVLGEDLSEPLILAQKVHAKNRTISIIILCSAAHHEGLKQEIRFNPFLGRDVKLEIADTLARLSEALEQAVTRSQKCRDHGMTMRSIMTGLKLPKLLIQEDSYLDRLLDHAPLGVITVDESGNINSLNRCARNLLNRDDPGMIGQTASSLFPRRYRKVLCDLLAGALGAVDEPATMKIYLNGKQSRCLALTVDPFSLRNGAPGNLVLLLDITERERTAELDEHNRQLQEEIVSATLTQEELRLAEEVATAVIHNIGNVVNSVNVSNTIMLDILKGSKLDLFLRVNQLLEENIHHLADFLTRDPRGLKVPESYFRLGKAMEKEHQSLVDELNELQKKIELIMQVTTSQQALACGKLSEKEAPLNDLIRETLKLQTAIGPGETIDVVLDLDGGEGVLVPNLKMAHVLMNILKNAREALVNNAPNDRILRLSIRRDSPLCLYLDIADNGPGIHPENMDKMFTYGFTTKVGGHGFGLNHCAHVMKELGGNISVASQGKGKGAQFSLRIPLLE